MHRIAKCELLVVEYTDGFGKREVRVGFAFGKEVRFLDEKLLSKPAQNWLAEGIFKKLAADGS